MMKEVLVLLGSGERSGGGSCEIPVMLKLKMETETEMTMLEKCCSYKGRVLLSCEREINPV